MVNGKLAWHICLNLIVLIFFVAASDCILADETKESTYSADVERDISEPTNDDSYIITKDITIVESYIENDTVKLHVINSSGQSFSDWAIIYQGTYKVLSVSNGILTSDEEVIIIKCDKKNYSIKSGESCTITLQISGFYSPTEEFRVYCLGEDETERQMIGDTINYNTITGEKTLDIFEISEDYDEKIKKIEAHNQKQETIMQSLIEGNAPLQPNVIIGTDDRTRVTSVNNDPYKRIALLIIKWSDGSKSRGTGFMISDYHMLTAAHNLYDIDNPSITPTSIEAYFGAYCNGYSVEKTSYHYSVCADYPTHNSAIYDWGCLWFSETPGRGYFQLGTKSTGDMENTYLTLCGYPGDKMASSPGAEIYGRTRYMYKMSSSLLEVKPYVLKYTIDTYKGQSGSPLYATTSIVYGLHSIGKASAGYNAGRRITSGLINVFINKGWYSLS